MKTLKNISTLFFALCIGISAANANASAIEERVLQLEATVRELTLQNAKLINENDRLSNAMTEALQAQREGKKVVSGCDVDELARLVIAQNDNSSRVGVVKGWVAKNGATCTKAQLTTIRTSLTTWGMSTVYLRDAIPIIDYYLNR
jgi:hypothetical protein